MLFDTSVGKLKRFWLDCRQTFNVTGTWIYTINTTLDWIVPADWCNVLPIVEGELRSFFYLQWYVTVSHLLRKCIGEKFAAFNFFTVVVKGVKWVYDEYTNLTILSHFQNLQWTCLCLQMFLWKLKQHQIENNIFFFCFFFLKKCWVYFA